MSYAWWTLLVGCADPVTEVGPPDSDEPSPTSGESPRPTDPPAPASCADPALTVDAGTSSLLVTEDAVYCVLGVADWDDLDRKRRVTFTPGNYAWPALADDVDYRVPACVEDGSAILGTAVGSLRVAESPFPWVSLEAELRMLVDNGQDLVVRSDKTGDDPPAETALDGKTTHATSDGTESVTLQVCDPDGRCDPLTACRTPRAEDAFDRLTFARGEVTLYLDVTDDGGVWIDPPRVLYRATGTIDGVSFDQADVFQLGYAYAAHGLDRKLVVRFDDPVLDACGLVGTYGREDEERLTLVDCNGDALGELGPLEGP